MTGKVVATLAACVYALRVTGFSFGDALLRGRIRQVIEYLHMAIIAGVLTLTTFSTAGEVTPDARTPGMVRTLGARSSRVGRQLLDRAGSCCMSTATRSPAKSTWQSS